MYGVYHDQFQRIDGRWWYVSRNYSSLARPAHAGQSDSVAAKAALNDMNGLVSSIRTANDFTELPGQIRGFQQNIRASQAGNGDYYAAPDVDQSFLVKATPVITWSTPADIAYGAALGSALRCPLRVQFPRQKRGGIRRDPNKVRYSDEIWVSATIST